MKKYNKILIVANGIIGKDPGLSGGDVRFLELAKHWQKMGQNVELLSSESAKIICKRFGIKLPIHVIPNVSDKSEREIYILRTVQTIFSQPNTLKNFEGVVYSVNDSIFDILPALRLKLSNPKEIKWVAVVHWLPPFPPWKRKKTTFFNSILFYINERISIWLANIFADKLLPVSETTALQMKQAHLNMNKVNAVKCGVDFKFIRKITEPIKYKKYDLVFMKRVQPVKGIFDFIEILKIVVKSKPHLKVIIIGGDGNDAEIVKNKIISEGLNDCVEFAGYIFDQKIKFIKLAQSKLFILPSYEENWAIAVGEAMAAKVPIIAYDLPELKYIWNNHVSWIPLGNIHLFAQTILKQLNNDQSSLITENIGFIKKYDWKNIASYELTIFNTLYTE